MAPRQERFIAEYCVDRNGAAAARRAGYSPRTARQAASYLLSNPDITAEINRRSQRMAAKLRINQEHVVKGFLDAFDAASLRGQPMAMIAAMREVGRLCGFYPDRESRRNRPAVTTGGTDIRKMSDGELFALLEGDG